MAIVLTHGKQKLYLSVNGVGIEKEFPETIVEFNSLREVPRELMYRAELIVDLKDGRIIKDKRAPIQHPD